MRLIDLDELTLAIEELDWYHISPEGKLVLGAKSDAEALYKADDIFKVLNNDTKCKTCIHERACEAWIQHGKTLYDDFDYDTEGCPHYIANLRCGDKTEEKSKRMTCKEKFMAEHPDVPVNPGSIRMGCPEDYGYSLSRDCFDDKDPDKCEKCWNREVFE